MHLIHINLVKGFRGGESQTLLLMKHLQQLDIQQTLICRKGGELASRTEACGIQINPISGLLSGHWKYLGGDLVHVHDGRSIYWAWLEYYFSKTPYIVTRRIPNSISQRKITYKAYRDAAALVAVSQDSARILSEQVRRPVQTILDAFTEYTIDPSTLAQIRQRIGTGPIIGHIGALVDHHKGQSVLIKSFLKLNKDRFPNARLVLVGEGPDHAHFVRLANNDPRIIFAGFQKNVSEWLRCFDIFAFPSYEEGLGSSVLDAMAMKIPVVTSNVGGLPELIGNHERGTIVDTHDPEAWVSRLEDILNQPSHYQERTEAAYRFAQIHNPGKMSQAYLDLYTATLANPINMLQL